MNRKKLLWSGSIIIGTTFVFIIYLSFNLLGITQSPKKIYELVIRTESAEKYYDGSSLSNDTWSLQSGKLKSDHHMEITMTANITNPGSIPNKIGVMILDNDNNDVTNNYKITYDIGSLTVFKRNLTIWTQGADKLYDGLPLSNNDWGIKSGRLMEGHTIEATMTSFIINPGSIENDIGVTILDKNGQDSTRFYNITYDMGELTILKYPLTIETGSQSKIYDGKPLTNNDWQIINGELKEGHSIEVTMSSSITDVGSLNNKIGVKILDQAQNDVTHSYEVNYILGELNIDPILLTLQSCSANKVYDGEPLSCDEWELLNGDVLAEHELQVDVVGEITNVGTLDNILHIYVIDKNGKNITGNYEVHYLLGQLSILSSIYSTGDLSRELQEGPKNEPYLEVYTNRSGKVYLRDQSFGNYDGYSWGAGTPYEGAIVNPLSFSSIALVESGRNINSIEIKHLKDHIPYLTPYYATDNLNSLNDIKNFGSVESSYSFDYINYDYVKSSNVLISDPLYANEERLYRNYVYENYLDIPNSTRDSMLEIAHNNDLNRYSPTIVLDVKNYIQNAATYNLDFEEIPAEVADIAVYFLTVSQEGICQHYATAATLMYRALGIPARYVTGFLGNGEANKWSVVTDAEAHAWVEVYIDGMGWVQVEVTGAAEAKHKITVTPKTVRLPYVEGNGPLKASDVHIQGFEDFASMGYSYQVNFGGELNQAGIETSTITEFIIYDEYGKNVTKKFDITYKTGILQYYQYQITFITGSSTKEYDGTKLKHHEWNIEGDLGQGHSLDVDSLVFSGEQLDMGLSQNRATFRIIDQDGNDVTSLYLVKNKFGSLMVFPRLIVIESHSATKAYDQSPLISYDYSIVEGALVNGDVLNVVFSGTQINVGSSDNTIESIAVMNGNMDITANYIIEIIEGKLTVTPAIN